MRRVNVYVDRPSCIALRVREQVRLDRLQPTAADGYVAEQHGALLAPGVTQLQLEAGIYHFRTLDDAELRVLAGGVQVASTSGDAKDPWPTPPAMNTDGAAAAAVWEAVAAAGHGPCGRVPALRVADDTEGVL
jgi:hypothetical protein